MQEKLIDAISIERINRETCTRMSEVSSEIRTRQHSLQLPPLAAEKEENKDQKTEWAG